ncbi:hypothetical protein SISNIDRAFT_167584 [Sistotremastrum niveocremeum HHB9708]|uniref:Uncharacterized protein n=1 Tax=Sistotremastrum niveocremeum HHB9708 TaxID=1314777 RepID=A0A164SAF0_9AGAM|nr:hypothetical protein SISNIDRAFT_167584 [Sistotremastrum niveocremeum HHB9708]
MSARTSRLFGEHRSPGRTGCYYGETPTCHHYQLERRLLPENRSLGHDFTTFGSRKLFVAHRKYTLIVTITQGLQPFAIAFHPIRASLILGIQSGMTGRKHTLEMVDVPSAWEPLPPDAAILFSSATECVSPPYEVLYEFEELPEYANVHLENGSPVIDLVTRKRISQGTKVIDESLLPIYHYSLPSTESHPVESARRLQGVFTQSSMFNVPFNQEIYLPYVQVADCGFLKPSQGPQWVNLQLSVLPDELLSRFRNPLAFDPLTGSLYIFIYGPGLCLIQY